MTGSCHYLEVGGKHILVDYGMEQGVNVFENVPLPVEESMIDYVLLTHAHIDHTGLLPLLYARDSGDRSMPRTRRWICAASCSVTVPTFR